MNSVFRLGLVSGLVIISFLFSSLSNAINVKHKGVPGSIALVDLGQSIGTAPAPTVRFGQQPIMVQRRNQRWFAVVGLSASLLPGNYILNVKDENDETSSRRFRVSPLNSSLSQRTRELPESLNGLDLSLQDNVLKIDLNKDFVTQSHALDFKFLAPVEPKLLIPYGLLVKPESNEQPVMHSGVTYFTKPEALVYAPAAGRISFVGEDKNDTLKIAIHHGQSLQSVLLDLGETVVELDQVVNQGELIGVVSESGLRDLGRVDWGLFLNGALIDPLSLSDDF